MTPAPVCCGQTTGQEAQQHGRGVGPSVRVRCWSCGAAGPWAGSYPAAVALWLLDGGRADEGGGASNTPPLRPPDEPDAAPLAVQLTLGL